MKNLFAQKSVLDELGINLILVYIHEAHTDDGWPIGQTLTIGENVTNCSLYSSIQTRYERCQQFLEFSKDCPYPLYYDNEKNEFSEAYQSWPDKYYLVNNENQKIVYESDVSSRKVAVVDIDVCWVIDYLEYSKNKGRKLDLYQNIENMVDSYQSYIQQMNITQQEFYGAEIE